MGFSDDIRTIAKTKELEEKIAKAVKDANDALKAAIKASRSMATQSGDNTKSIQSGQPAGNDPVVATLPTGAQQSTPSNGTPVPANHSASGYSPRDSANASDTNNAVSRLTLGNKTDLSDAAKPTDNGASGDGILALAQLGGSDSLLNALLAKMEIDGVSPVDRQRFKEAYLAIKYRHEGEKNGQDIADNTPSSPQPATTSDKQVLYPGNNQGQERLTAVIGTDQDRLISSVTGVPTAVKVILKGNYPKPTDAAAAAAGQNPWDDGDTPPIKKTYVAGSFWRINAGYSGAQIVGQTFEEILAARKGRGAQNYAYALDGAGALSLVTSTSPQSTDQHIIFSTNAGGNVGDTAGSLGGTIYTLSTDGSVGSQEYGLEVCPGASSAGTATCALEAPRETAWPTSGTYSLLLQGGLFLASLYDSEIPFKYTGHQSAVRVALGDGVNVLDDRFIDIELGIQGGYVITTIAADGATVVGANYYDSDGILKAANIAPEDIKYHKPRW